MYPLLAVADVTSHRAACPKCGKGPLEWWKTIVGTAWWRCLACGEFGRND